MPLRVEWPGSRLYKFIHSLGGRARPAVPIWYLRSKCRAESFDLIPAFFGLTDRRRATTSTTTPVDLTPRARAFPPTDALSLGPLSPHLLSPPPPESSISRTRSTNASSIRPLYRSIRRTRLTFRAPIFHQRAAPLLSPVAIALREYYHRHCRFKDTRTCKLVFFKRFGSRSRFLFLSKRDVVSPRPRFEKREGAEARFRDPILGFPRESEGESRCAKEKERTRERKHSGPPSPLPLPFMVTVENSLCTNRGMVVVTRIWRRWWCWW